MKSIKTSKNKYLLPIESEIDLHGMTRSEASQEVMHFLKECVSNHNHKVRIITGRGLHSINNEGVLKSHIENYLVDHGYKFSNAKINEGGEGALVVLLD